MRSLRYRAIPAHPEGGDLSFELIWLLDNAFNDPWSGADPLELELGREDIRALTLLKLDRPPPVADALQALIHAIETSPSGKVRVWTQR